MELIPKNKMKIPTLKELGIDADGMSGDISQTVGKGPMTFGLFTLNGPGAFEYNYTFEEFKMIIEGEFTISDNKGNKIVAKSGDAIHFKDGDKITFDTNSHGVAFYVAQREKG